MPLGSLVQGDDVNLLMVTVALTEELINDDKKLEEVLIKNISPFCDIHKDDKSTIFCINCAHSICPMCDKDHKGHSIIQKIELINYERILRENNNLLSDKLKDLGLDGNYSDFLKKYKQDLNGQCEQLLDLVEQIKNKQVKMVNEFKEKIDSFVPNILDYKDKLTDLIGQVSEYKKETILTDDKEFLEFYNKYQSIEILNDKYKEHITMLKNKLDIFKNVFTEFKSRTDEILASVNSHFDRIKDYQLIEGIVPNDKMPDRYYNESSELEASEEAKKAFRTSSNFHSSKLNLINIMTSPKRGRSLLKNFERYKKIEKSKNGDNVSPRLASIKEMNNIKNVSEFNSKSARSEIYNELTYIASIEVSTRNIYVFNKVLKTVVKKEIDFTNLPFKKFEAYQSILNYNNLMFISGSKTFCEYDIELDITRTLKNLPNSHSYHSMLSVKENIFVLSGFNCKKAEKYSIQSDTWSNLSDLNYPRSWPNTVSIDSYIYVFGGLTEPDKTGNKIIERLDTRNPNSNWEIININYDDSYPLYCGIIQLSPNELLLVGGRLSKSEEDVDKCVLLNLTTRSILPDDGLSLPNKDEFDGNNFLALSVNTFALFSSVCPDKLFIYDKDCKSFEIVTSSK